MTYHSDTAANAAGFNLSAVKLLVETPADLERLTELHELVFGPGRFAKTAFRLREGKQPRYDLSKLAWQACGQDDRLAGAVRMTDIVIGGRAAVLLGPLCVRPELKGLGLGRALMAAAMQAAWQAGDQAVLLVGDAAYYAAFGFKQAADVQLPGPADPERTLIALNGGNVAGWTGKVA
ncbi:MAG: N-acetyltransferase [Pseudomonadota bacterium]